jgi:hypothetical protein
LGGGSRFGGRAYLLGCGSQVCKKMLARCLVGRHVPFFLPPYARGGGKCVESRQSVPALVNLRRVSRPRLSFTTKYVLPLNPLCLRSSQMPLTEGHQRRLWGGNMIGEATTHKNQVTYHHLPKVLGQNVVLPQLIKSPRSRAENSKRRRRVDVALRRLYDHSPPVSVCVTGPVPLSGATRHSRKVSLPSHGQPKQWRRRI